MNNRDTMSSTKSGQGAPSLQAMNKRKQQQSNLAKDLCIDMMWQRVPINRRTRHPLMPKILRDLAPQTNFNPATLWYDEKQRLEMASKGKSNDAVDKKSGGKKKGGKKQISKEEQIRLDAEKKRHETDIERDEERLGNALKKDRSLLWTSKMSTPFGRLHRLLEILNISVERKDKPLMYDVLWALEDMELYQSAKEEEAKAKAKEKEEEKAKDGKKKKVQRSRECQLYREFRKIIRKAEKSRETEDIVAFQMKEMADRLPPLSKFTGGFRLDQWQKDVLQLIDSHQNVIVCAPTSSGKTIISTYVCVESERVCFVVPTEPLVWQVSAMFHSLLKGGVALCTDGIIYRPEQGEVKVLVGTPFALESALTKARGLVGNEVDHKVDFTQLDPGFDEFKYIVFDEVHNLDGDDGEALQRLIRLFEGNFLALSATIGNAEQLQSWWRMVKNEQADDLHIVRAPDVHLKMHQGRFINLQRYVMTQSDELRVLHPCAALSLRYLQEHGFSSASLAFTPLDSYTLWEELTKVFDMELIQDVAPSSFFLAKIKGQERIVLDEAKAYEEALKAKLSSLSQSNPDQVNNLLERFQPKDIKEDGVKIYDFVRHAQKAQMFPVLCFHLDLFECIRLFKELLTTTERKQREKYPNYYQELQKRMNELAKMKAAQDKRVLTKEEEEDEKKDGDDVSQQFIDISAPHPEFVFNPANIAISALEFQEIREELKDEIPSGEHAILRALRRGFGIYVDDSFYYKYRRVVQRLAQQGKLAVVFSDNSLGYGVNMPFRTCVFSSAMHGLMDALKAQQMSGRAGRRGLDTQGSLVYLNMGVPKIQELMLGSIPAITGKEPRYPVIALHRLISDNQIKEMILRRDEPVISKEMEKWLTGHTLEEFCKQDDADEGEMSYLEKSRKLMIALGFIDENEIELSCHHTVAVMVWEMRKMIPEALAISFFLDFFKELFVDQKHKDYAENVGVQIEFFSIFLPLVDRVECPDFIDPLFDLSFYKKDQARKDVFERWLSLLEDSQERLEGLPWESELRLGLTADFKLDSSLFIVIRDNSLETILSKGPQSKLKLQHRLRRVGDILMIMHNCLMQGRGEYEMLEQLLRKSFMRIRYIISDSIAVDTGVPDLSESEALIPDDHHI